MTRYKRPNGSAPRIEYTEAPCPNPKLKGPCHIFTGSTTGGYGSIGVGGITMTVHLYLWKTERGPIPKGMEIDHQCMVRLCCNLDHLRVVTGRINRIENSNGKGAINAVATHCKHGHPFDAANTSFVTPARRRRCLACHRNRERAARRWAKA